MFDMRAYVASLAAVFLALGIGILLGTIITDKGTVSRQQNALLESIESRVTSVSDNNKQLKKELLNNQQFEKEILPHVVQGRLAERHIVLLHSNNIKIDLQKQIERVIGSASGTMTRVTIDKKAFLYSPENLENVKKIMTSSNEISDNNAIPRAFASALSGTGSSESLAKLKENGFIDFQAVEIPFFSAVLIMLDNKADGPVMDKFYQPLVEEFGKFGVPVVVAQPSYETEPIAHKLNSQLVMSIDNIDMIPGQISMILGLTGKKGSFGLHDRSMSLIPSVETGAGNQ